jgi:hypothetical protein
MRVTGGKAISISVRVVEFPGSDEERRDLVAAVRRHCACHGEHTTVLPDPCAPHDLLQLETTVKRLVFYRRWHRSRLELL